MPARLGITSISLGRAPTHTMAARLAAAAAHGIEGIEMFHSDIERHAHDLGLLNPSSAQTDTAASSSALLAAAHDLRRLCDSHGLTVIVLQPFACYEGLLDRSAHARLLATLTAQWFPLAHALGTRVIQIPSSYAPASACTGDMDAIVADMRAVAALGAAQTPAMVFAYEALCFGTHVDTWEQAWEVVRRVDRPNFQACLDTFNICGRVYADPALAGCLAPGGEAAVAASVRELVTRVDVAKIAFFQVVDAERLAAPLVEGHELYDDGADMPPRMAWSRSCRLFYGEAERGAFMPVLTVCKAVLEELGFEGWVSFELFNRSLYEEGDGVIEKHAARAAQAWKRLKEDVRF